MRIAKRLLYLISVASLFSCSNQEPVGDETNPSIDSTDTRPNVLLIIADDLGFTDIGAFGSEIPTPNLDALAAEGVRLTNLHAAASCQPTRSMLMGSAPASKAIINRPPLAGGERDNLFSLEWPIIPELLQEAGYATYMAGKWDLGWDEGYTPATRGFDRSFVQLNGSSSFFAEPLLMGETSGFEEDGQTLNFSDLPEDFYVTDTYTEKMLGYLEASPEGQPWFAYLPYTAPHWPLQLPDDWLDRHAGAYAAGYDQLRASRVEGAIAQGVLPEGFDLDGFQPTARPWQELEEGEQIGYSRAQEIYAGMIEHLDERIGQVIDHLKNTGQLENTIVIFSSDHGASSGEYGASSYSYSGTGPQVPDHFDNSLENYGRMNSFVDHGLGYAEAASAPFTNSKGSLHEGGLRAAAFVYYPKEVAGGRVSHSFMTMMDLLPTLMDATNTELPSDSFRGREIRAPYGVSAWPYLTGQADTVHTDTAAGWSSGRGAALIKKGYKIIREPRQSNWKLFNIETDPGERIDLAAEFPELVGELETEWEENWQ